MKKRYSILVIISYLAILVALYFTFLFAPTERSMGDVQRIFYFHVPSAWAGFLSFFIVCLASIAFLKTGKKKWDTLAHASAEVGVFFFTLVLLTGPLWAKPVWNVYWSWDARLTTSLVLWLIYIAYLMLRHFVDDRERGARFAAVFGIIGFLDVPIVYMSIRWWRTLHPNAVLAGGEGSGLAPQMLLTLMICLAAFSILYVTLLVLRTRTLQLEERVQHLKTRIE